MSRNVKPRWLDRSVAPLGPYLILVLSQEEFDLVLKGLHGKESVEWQASETAEATTTTFTDEDGGLVCVISLSGWEGCDPIEVAGILVHEAVHVWQKHAERIGETKPGDEQEAYAIEHISTRLMTEFRRRTQ